MKSVRAPKQSVPQKFVRKQSFRKQADLCSASVLLLIGLAARPSTTLATQVDSSAAKQQGSATPLKAAHRSAPAGILDSPTVPAGYHLSFDDEFNTLSISDGSASSATWFSHTIHCCLRDTSAPSTPTVMAGVTSPPGQNPFSLMEGGGLDIRLQKTNGTWYSGVLATVDNTGKGFSQRYGYFEMKARFPAGPGPWPAFWLVNTAATATHAGSGEIDVVESYMFAPSYVNVAIHDWSHHKTLGHTTAKTADLTRGFHTFGFLWTPAMMTFYCDNAVIYRIATPAIMNQPYYPIIDLGLGGGWPTNKTPRQSDMLIKYVRVYSP